MKPLTLLILLTLTLLSMSSNSYANNLDTLENSAKQGDPAAQVKLARMYQAGKGAEQDLSKAFYWYKQAAEKGYIKAQRPLGALYEMGQGVSQNFQKAAYWYRQAAKQGIARAQVNLGILYETGNGVEQSYPKALDWYRKAAKKGYGRGMNHLGLLYEKGLGTTKNIHEAIFHYKNGAKAKYSKAMLNLGRIYEYGASPDGPSKDLSMAAHWYRKAVAVGYLDAKTDLKRVHASLQKKKADEETVSQVTAPVTQTEKPAPPKTSPVKDDMPQDISPPTKQPKKTATSKKTSSPPTAAQSPVAKESPLPISKQKNPPVPAADRSIKNTTTVTPAQPLTDTVTAGEPTPPPAPATSFSTNNSKLLFIIILANALAAFIFWRYLRKTKSQKIITAKTSEQLQVLSEDIQQIKKKVKELKDCYTIPS